MLYLCVGIYLLLALPLTLMLYSMVVAAKWGDDKKEMEHEFRRSGLHPRRGKRDLLLP